MRGHKTPVFLTLRGHLLNVILCVCVDLPNTIDAAANFWAVPAGEFPML